MLQHYLETLLQTCRHVDARGLLQMQALHDLLLEDVYVPLTARLEQDTSAVQELQDLENHRQWLDSAEEAEAAGDFLPGGRQPPRAETGLGLEQLWERGEHWVILGAPGSGKSTLLKYQALRQARDLLDTERGDLPIVVDLGRFAHAWRLCPDWPVAEALFAYLLGPGLADMGLAAEQRLSLLGSFKIALAGHSALLLLDGLDSVHDAALRQRVGEAVDALLHRYPGNRCLLTAHMLNDPAGVFSRGFRFATLEPFTLEQVRRFFRQWMFAVEKLAAPLADEATRRHAAREAAELLARLEDKPQLCLQISNPLLCTLIGLVHRQVGSLPEQQVELYKLCVEHFILHWETLKRRRGLGDGGLGKDQTLAVLEAVAFYLHAQRGTHRAPAEALRGVARDYLQSACGLDADAAHARAEGFLELLRLDSGLLAHYGDAEYGFFHLTFQEYLAARLLGHDPARREHILREHLFDPHWRGVIRLAAAHQGVQGESEGSAFVESLENHPHPREPVMHYAFRMAFLCMRAGRVAFDTADRMFETWVRLYLDEPVLQPALNRLLRGADGMLRYKPQSLTPLLAALEHADPAVRGKAAEALGNLKDLAAVPALLRCLEHDSHALVRARAAETLGCLHAAEAVPLLLSTLKEDGAFFVRRHAAQALDHLRDPAALPTLLKALRDREAATRWRAAEALGNLKDPAAVPALREALRADNVAAVRWRAAEALGPFKDMAALGDLLAALKQDPDPLVRSRAAEALGNYKPIESLGALLEALQSDHFPAVRWRAAQALGQFKDPLAVPVLLVTLKQDPDNAVRWSAAEALGTLKDPAAVPALLDALREDLDPAVRWSAAESLGLLRDTRAVEALLYALRRDRYASVRGKASQALGYLKDHSATADLLKTLGGDADSTVRRLAAEALGYLRDPRAVPELLRSLREDGDATVRWSAAAALENIEDPAAVPALVEVLRNDADLAVRWRAAQTLEILDLGCLL